MPRSEPKMSDLMDERANKVTDSLIGREVEVRVSVVRSYRGPSVHSNLGIPRMA